MTEERKAEDRDMRRTGGKLPARCRQLLIAWGLSAGLIALDLVTKYFAAKTLPLRPYEVVPGVFSLVYVENRGAAFSILQGSQWLIIVLTLAVIAGLIAMQLKLGTDRHGFAGRIISAVLLAGAVGNLVDRITLGYVRDFLYVKLIDFPVFNVADICVTVSAVLLIFWILFDKSGGTETEACTTEEACASEEECTAEECTTEE